MSVGRLSVGASRETVEQIFPFKKDVDQDTSFPRDPSCGAIEEVNWVDDGDASGKITGNIFVYLREGRVFQMASSTTRFRTVEGIVRDSLPDSVKKYYGDLKAYALAGSGGQMFDFHDFVYWVSRPKGIAFQIAFSRRYRRPLVHDVIVFQPNTDFLPQGCIYAPGRWLEIPAYSLEYPLQR
jgi:hypothetical protein